MDRVVRPALVARTVGERDEGDALPVLGTEALELDESTQLAGALLERFVQLLVARIRNVEEPRTKHGDDLAFRERGVRHARGCGMHSSS